MSWRTIIFLFLVAAALYAEFFVPNLGHQFTYAIILSILGYYLSEFFKFDNPVEGIGKLALFLAFAPIIVTLLIFAITRTTSNDLTNRAITMTVNNFPGVFIGSIVGIIVGKFTNQNSNS